VVSKKKESQGQEDTQKEKQFEDILLEKDAISKLIKHRDPFLFIDKVLVKDLLTTPDRPPFSQKI
jgi:predicted GTPase